MATFAFTDASVVINSVDLSDHVRQVTLSVSGDDLDDTAMGDTYRSRIGGLLDWSVSLEFNQDFAANEVDATLFALMGTTTTITIKPTSGSVTGTNPSYSGSVLVNDYSPVSNSVGDLATVSMSWPGAGALTRAES